VRVGGGWNWFITDSSDISSVDPSGSNTWELDGQQVGKLVVWLQLLVSLFL
jgi:hypothetical protein